MLLGERGRFRARSAKATSAKAAAGRSRSTIPTPTSGSPNDGETAFHLTDDRYVVGLEIHRGRDREAVREDDERRRYHLKKALDGERGRQKHRT